MGKLILAIDQGTTGTTATLVDLKTMKFLGRVNKEFPQFYPKASWVEHDLNEIWKSVEISVRGVLKKCHLKANQIAAIGITNQRETTCAYDTKGRPIGRAIVWQDRRTSDLCRSLKESHGEKIKDKTGLTMDPYFSATKMKWLLENNIKVQKAKNKGELHLSTIDSYLLFKLTSGVAFKTDATNASRTMLMDLKTGQWDNELLQLFSIPQNALPSIEDSITTFGVTKNLAFLPDGIPVTAMIGDQQAALFGQGGIHPGDAKCTYGTGAFLLLNTGTECTQSQHGLLTTVALSYENKKTYALEGSTFIAGAAVQWLRDNLKIIKKSSDIEGLARQVKNLNEMEFILFLPFFTGLGSPYWRSEAKATITGLTRDTGNHHLARACLDGIALSINDLISAMSKESPAPLSELRVDGGACANNLLMEIQASVSKLSITRPKVIETTSYGAALAAGIGIGAFKMEDIQKLWRKDKTFTAKENLVSFYGNKIHQWGQFINKQWVN